MKYFSQGNPAPYTKTVFEFNITAVLVVFFRNVSRAENSCFLAKIHHKQGFKVNNDSSFSIQLIQILRLSLPENMMKYMY